MTKKRHRSRSKSSEKGASKSKAIDKDEKVRGRSRSRSKSPSKKLKKPATSHAESAKTKNEQQQINTLSTSNGKVQTDPNVGSLSPLISQSLIEAEINPISLTRQKLDKKSKSKSPKDSSKSKRKDRARSRSRNRRRSRSRSTSTRKKRSSDYSSANKRSSNKSRNKQRSPVNKSKNRRSRSKSSKRSYSRSSRSRSRSSSGRSRSSSRSSKYSRTANRKNSQKDKNNNKNYRKPAAKIPETNSPKLPFDHHDQQQQQTSANSSQTADSNQPQQNNPSLIIDNDQNQTPTLQNLTDNQHTDNEKSHSRQKAPSIFMCRYGNPNRLRNLKPNFLNNYNRFFNKVNLRKGSSTFLKTVNSTSRSVETREDPDQFGKLPDSEKTLSPVKEIPKDRLEKTPNEASNEPEFDDDDQEQNTLQKQSSNELETADLKVKHVEKSTFSRLFQKDDETNTKRGINFDVIASLIGLEKEFLLNGENNHIDKFNLDYHYGYEKKFETLSNVNNTNDELIRYVFTKSLLNTQTKLKCSSNIEDLLNQNELDYNKDRNKTNLSLKNSNSNIFNECLRLLKAENLIN